MGRSDANDWEDWFGLCGTVLEGKYQIRRAVGSGSHGVVYHAMETGLMPGPVAIKCLKVPLSLDDRDKDAFLLQLQHEGRLLRDLSTRHAGITQARGAGTVTTPAGEWVPYLVLEWLSGDSLETYQRKRGGRGMSLREAVELLDMGARALAAANAAGVAHRDVKPANLFVLDDSRRIRTKVLDFGVAKAFDDHVPFEHDRTAPLAVPRTGAFTPAYGAPEQFDPALGVTGPHTDVFALALVLIELVSGRRALEGKSHYNLEQCASSRAVRPSLAARGVAGAPEAVERVLATALAVDVADRFPDVGAFWDAMRAAALGDATALGASAPKPAEVVAPPPPKRLRASFVYAEEDADFAMELDHELSSPLSDLIDTWHPRPVSGPSPSGLGAQDVEKADVVLVLVTKALVDSGYFDGNEIKRARERHRRGEARVVPVMVQKIVGWWRSPFRDMVAVPRFAVPITQWTNRKLAWRDVTESLRVIGRDLMGAVPAHVPPRPARSYRLDEVFKKSGLPTVTFVETAELRELRTCLLEPGRGLVVEGPSGVGKTTALRRAVEEARAEGAVAPELTILNAWNEGHVKRIGEIASWHERGIVAIDDFHYLEPQIAERVIRYARYLADEQTTDKKVVIVGIPGSRQSFASFGSDVPRRFDQIRFGRAKTDDILWMIEKGERALGVTIERKSDIAVAAAGSISIAQFICYWICQAALVEKTQGTHRTVTWSVSDLLERILRSLRGDFNRLVVELGGLGDVRDTTMIRILKALPACEDGLLPLSALQDGSDPALSRGVKALLGRGELAKLYKKPDPDRDRLLYYDPQRHVLLIENPQLTFYLAHERSVDLAREAGRGGAFERPRVIIHHSPYDAGQGSDWLSPVKECLRSLTDYDTDVYNVPLTVGQTLLDDVRRIASEATALILIVTRNYMRSFKSPDELRWAILENTHPKLAVFPLVHESAHGADSLLRTFPPLWSKQLSQMRPEERAGVYSGLLEAVRRHVHKTRFIDD